jgi:hypothetical protein
MDDRMVLGDMRRMSAYGLGVLNTGNLFYRRSMLCRCLLDGPFNQL